MLRLLFLLAAVVPAEAVRAGDAQPHNRMLHQAGMKIVDEQGREIRLRGVSLGGWFVWEGWIFGNGVFTAQSTMLRRLEKAVGQQEAAAFHQQVYDNFIADEDVRQIARAGFNCVRVPLHYKQFDDPRGWKMLDHVVESCQRNHVYVVLDMHGVPGGSLGTLEPSPIWKSDQTRALVTDLWKQIAMRYRDRQWVAGYDLLNEPLPPSGAALGKVNRQLIDAIRQVDKCHMIVVEGNKFSTDFSMYDKPLDANQVYSFHMYTWFGDDRNKKLAEYRAIADRDKTPLWVGEFGENTYDMVHSTVQMYEQCPQINGWAFWTWKKAPNNHPGIATFKMSHNWTTTMNWLGALFDGKPPESDTLHTGMKEFLDAVKMSNCQIDQRMVNILLRDGN